MMKKRKINLLPKNKKKKTTLLIWATMILKLIKKMN